MSYQIGATYTILVSLDAVEDGVTTAEPHTNYEYVIIHALDAKSKKVLKKYSRDTKEGYETLAVVDANNLTLTIKSATSRLVSEGGNLLLYMFLNDEDAEIEGNYMGDAVVMGPWAWNPTISEVA
jgi:hypothetical protein